MLKIAIASLLILCSCMSHTATINCCGKNFDDCARAQLGARVHVTRAVSMGGDMYMVDYQ